MEPGRTYQISPAQQSDRDEIGTRLSKAASSAVREPMQIAPPLERRAHKPPVDIPPHAFWNGIARAWFVEVDGEAVRLDPQPPAPGVQGVPVSPRIDL